MGSVVVGMVIFQPSCEFRLGGEDAVEEFVEVDLLVSGGDGELACVSDGDALSAHAEHFLVALREVAVHRAVRSPFHSVWSPAGFL